MSSTKALILGGGRDLWKEVAPYRFTDAEVFVTGLAGIAWPGRIDHWCFADPQLVEPYAFLRCHKSEQANGRQRFYIDPGTIQFHTLRPKRFDPPAFARVWDLPRDGSSSLFATRIALNIVDGPVLVCGVPLDSDGHFFSPPWHEDSEYEGYRYAWEGLRGHPRIRATSGFTKELFGPPEGGFF